MLHFLSQSLPLDGVIEKDYAGQGVYVIFCQSNYKCYVGSSKNITHRLLVHRHKLRNNAHPNRHLQNAYNAYGESDFLIKPIQKMDGYSTEQLLYAEKFWMDTLDVMHSGFNQRKEPSSNAGIATKESTKKKISEAVKLYYVMNPHARERVRAQGHANKGKWLVAWIAKNGSVNKGKKEDPAVTKKRADKLRKNHAR